MLLQKMTRLVKEAEFDQVIGLSGQVKAEFQDCIHPKTWEKFHDSAMDENEKEMRIAWKRIKRRIHMKAEKKEFCQR